MDTQRLELFVDVYRAGSFAAVSTRRRIDPSVVSRAIALLEEDLGTKLFQRTTRKLAPTEAGEHFFREVEPLLEELGRAVDSLRETQQKPRGVVRVTMPVVFGQLLLLPRLASFREAYPDIQLDLRLSNTLADIVDERIDVAVRLGKLPDSSYQAYKLADLRYVVCASPAYLARRGRPQVPADLGGHDCPALVNTTRHGEWRFRPPGQPALEQAVPVHVPLRFDSGHAMIEAARLGLGIIMVPSLFIGELLARGELVELFPALEATPSEFGLGAWILYPSRKYLPARIRALVDFLKAEFGELRDGPWPPA